ncbi:NAD(P)(+) transhydrogenase (Re/Si-specific) subunit beta [Taibaiella chishuiensis]|uniref:NAD(P) transhydrogenase subunit beta n=1 Tax=Taibaiella chishuiensis TaxID=1434707 RepID=A0A2P8DCV6_9BACT|nr:NAD(P)(+) transhydrogenase (Re/Si-specific) subunit beta [Taibaiella chishuiensis]PSK95042.1 NAD(P) transhydrogenase subunit beta [Taibaiella chishuiensis]
MNFVLLLSYLIGSVTFIVGLKMLSHPDKARNGNLIAAVGMLIAIVATIFLYHDESGARLHNYGWIFSGLIIGTVIGTATAKKVKMTAMPEMVSLFNGMGGACAMLISIVEFNHLYGKYSSVFANGTEWQQGKGSLVIILLGLIIGSVSFAGSIIAWGKLNGSIKDKRIPAGQALNFILLGGIVVLSVLLFTGSPAMAPLFFYAVLLLSLLYGILFVMPIGGADMPVVISLLNSFTGVAAACGGFLYNNPVMLTGGILVGSAGTILTILMCKAMNRSLKNVLIGAIGAASGNAGAGNGKEQGNYKEISVNDSAVLMAYARKVFIIPGYGLAVAQAQHACHELEKLLEEKGVEVKYGIHPVAGRMPGHMNVLLAEADVPYEKLLEMEEANSEFPTTNVVLILGANDVVNPAAKEDPASPIYGMPILEVEQAEHIIVNKRSMKPGYAGIENDLFFKPKTSMLFGDAKKVLQELVAELKSL